ncbi:hypothetical protein Tco_1023894 [Tanacetum coccineum]
MRQTTGKDYSKPLPVHTQPSLPQNVYPPPIITQQPQAEFPQLDLGLEVLTFLPGDDPIACMNKAMAFLSAVFTPRYPSTNNQLRSSSNPRNQATVHRLASSRKTRQCTQPKKIRDASWFKEKVLLVQEQTEGKELDEEQLSFLADPKVADAKVVLMAILSSCDSDVLSEVPYSDTSQNDMMN